MTGPFCLLELLELRACRGHTVVNFESVRRLFPFVGPLFLGFLLSCNTPGEPSGSRHAFDQGRPDDFGSVTLGRVRDLDSSEPKGPRQVAGRAQQGRNGVALATWASAPTEVSARLLAGSYFPDLISAGSSAGDDRTLTIREPRVSGDAFSIQTRGMRFEVIPAAGAMGVAAHVDTLDGRDGAVDRFEEFDVLDAPAIWRQCFSVVLPPEIIAVRDAGEYLELLDDQDRPALRMHYPIARDRNGHTRTGTASIIGIDSGSALGAPGAPVRYSLVSNTLSVEASIDLARLSAPIVVDPGWSSTSSMATARYAHTATTLSSGKVLVAGGFGSSSELASAELFDPETGRWSATGSMSVPRQWHTATLLRSGRVLVAGGFRVGGSLASVDIYDPSTGTWSAAAPLPESRYGHTATSLLTGDVLVAGGLDDNGVTDTDVPSAAIYREDADEWVSGSGPVLHNFHCAVRLADGRVLVAGGSSTSNQRQSDIYDPATNGWSQTGSTTVARSVATATVLRSGRVLLAGGVWGDSLQSAELYDPAAGTWTATNSMGEARDEHTSTLLPSGRVLVVGGIKIAGTSYTLATSSELFDPATQSWNSAGASIDPRYMSTATLLENGKVLLAGGNDSYATAAVDLFEPAPPAPRSAGSMSQGREFLNAIVLRTGRVLVTGGGYDTRTDEYDPAVNQWSLGPSLNVLRPFGQSATLLHDGRVLVAGGGNGAAIQVPDVELFDPIANVWSFGAPMPSKRSMQSAVALDDGDVLVVGGYDTSGFLNTAVRYDVLTATWSSAGTLTHRRQESVVTKLLDGRVLVAGGDPNYSRDAELYDPVTNQWSLTGKMTAARWDPTGALLPSGRVLVAGGSDGFGYLSSAEIYDPASNTWAATGPMHVAREAAAATLLPSGKLVVSGGANTSGSINEGLDSVEVYDPGTGLWTTGGVLANRRLAHIETVLPSGKVLVAGGTDTNGYASYFTNTELYIDGDPSDAWRPVVTGPAILPTSGLFELTGTGFRGNTEGGSGGTSSSAEDTPIVRLQAIQAGSLFDVTIDDFTATTIDATLAHVVPGYYMLTAQVGGVSGGRVVRAGDQAPTAADQSIVAIEDSSSAFTLAGSDADEDPVVATVVSPPAHGTLVLTGLDVHYSPTADFSGPDSFTWAASDGFSTSAPATVSITVLPVNDPPTLAPIAGPISVLEDSGATTVELSGIGPGAPDESGQHLTISASSSDPSVIPAPTVGALAGTSADLTFAPAPDANGSATITVTVQDDGGTANGGRDTIQRTFDVVVTPVNDPPELETVASPIVLLEDSSASLTLTVRPGPPNESSQHVTITATSSNVAILPDPAVTIVGTEATMTFSPAPDASGAVTVTLVANDDGGTANEGVDHGMEQFDVTVLAVNDPPTLNPIAGVSVVENSPATAITLSGIRPGPANESAQHVTVSALSSNPAIVPNPATGAIVGTSAVLAFAPAPNAVGTATIIVTVKDDGGVANGGVDSTQRAFDIQVQPEVNAPPTIDPVLDETVLEDAPAVQLTLTGIHAGPAAEAGQHVSITASSSDHGLIPDPFVSGVVGSTAMLTFAPIGNAFGSATINLTVKDDGGVANGGADTTQRSFDVVVSAVNDPPTIDPIPSSITLLEDSPAVQLSLDGITPGPANEDTQSVTISAVSSNPELLPDPTVGPLSGTSATLTLAPRPDRKGTVTVTVRLKDDGGTANGGIDTTVDSFDVVIGQNPALSLEAVGSGCECSLSSPGAAPRPAEILAVVGLALGALTSVRRRRRTG